MLAALLFGTAGVSAHAFLDHAEPRVGSTVRTPPRALSLSFSETLEPSFSSATVADASGKRVDTGAKRVSGKVMTIPLRALRPGTYRVNWHVLSIDTHRTQGSFTFRVGE